jgi:hypothetical protein
MERFDIVGSQFRKPAKGILASLPAGFPLYAIAEYDNPYDGNAISVRVKTEAMRGLEPSLYVALIEKVEASGFEEEEFNAEVFYHLGYIKKEIAAQHKLTVGAEYRGNLSFSATGWPQIIVDLTIYDLVC